MCRCWRLSYGLQPALKGQIGCKIVRQGNVTTYKQVLLAQLNRFDGRLLHLVIEANTKGLLPFGVCDYVDGVSVDLRQSLNSARQAGAFLDCSRGQLVPHGSRAAKRQSPHPIAVRAHVPTQGPSSVAYLATCGASLQVFSTPPWAPSSPAPPGS